VSIKTLPDPVSFNHFRHSSERFLYAKYKVESPDSESELYYLKEGQGVKGSVWFSTNLKCPVPHCDKPELTLIPRQGDKREAFKHANFPSHSLEESYLIQSEAMVKKLLKEKYPEVVINSIQNSEILLTWPNGKKQVIIIEYNLTTFSSLNNRIKLYLEKGARPTYLFGHTPQNFPDWISQMKQVKLSYLQKEILEAGFPLFWINPIEEKIISILKEIKLHACLVASCDGKAEECIQTFIVEYDGKGNNSYLALDSFFSSNLISERIITPAIKQILEEELLLERIYKIAEERKVKEKSNMIQVDSEIQRLRDEKIKETIKNSQSIQELTEAKIQVKQEARIQREMKPSRTGYSCSVCGYPLDITLKDEGKHLLC